MVTRGERAVMKLSACRAEKRRPARAIEDLQVPGAGMVQYETR